jgi:hypothetical protein
MDRGAVLVPEYAVNITTADGPSEFARMTDSMVRVDADTPEAAFDAAVALERDWIRRDESPAVVIGGWVYAPGTDRAIFEGGRS